MHDGDLEPVGASRFNFESTDAFFFALASRTGFTSARAWIFSRAGAAIEPVDVSN